MKITKEDFEKVLLDARDAGIQAVIGMEDTFPCGGAYHEVEGNSPMVRAFKKYGTKNGQYYECMGWNISRGVYKGYTLSHGGNRYQNMHMHSKRATAESIVFGTNNLITNVNVYIN